MTRFIVRILLLVLAACPLLQSAAFGLDFHVGPGQKYARIVDVPWEHLMPGDAVFVHWRPADQGGDYHEKINLTRAGTAEHPIRIVGVKGPHGERPCLNGKDAITRTIDSEANSTYYEGNQDRGILCFSARHSINYTYGIGADHWDISGLKLTGARPANNYVDSYGKPRDYQRTQGGLGSAGAGVFIDRGNYLHFSDMEITDNQDGFFGSSDNYGANSRHVHDCILENSLLYGNGVANNYGDHNCYVEIANMTIRGNWFGPLVAGSGGSHIKDRGANVVMENNRFENAPIPLFLDPPENSMGWMDKQPGFNKITVRNNVFHEPAVRQDFPVMIMTGFADNRTGVNRTVLISHNTFVFASSQQDSWGIGLIDLLGAPQTVRFEHNVVARFAEGEGRIMSGIILLSKNGQVDESSLIDFSTGNWMVKDEQWTVEQPGNGNAKIVGVDQIGSLPGNRPELEQTLGINLHDATSNDFGRFDPKTNAWFHDHQAGAVLVPSSALPLERTQP